jgi:hypothetical protein
MIRYFSRLPIGKQNILEKARKDVMWIFPFRVDRVAQYTSAGRESYE